MSVPQCLLIMLYITQFQQLKKNLLYKKADNWILLKSLSNVRLTIFIDNELILENFNNLKESIMKKK